MVLPRVLPVAARVRVVQVRVVRARVVRVAGMAVPRVRWEIMARVAQVDPVTTAPAVLADPATTDQAAPAGRRHGMATPSTATSAAPRGVDQSAPNGACTNTTSER
jgi:hypothetical protein